MVIGSHPTKTGPKPVNAGPNAFPLPQFRARGDASVEGNHRQQRWGVKRQAGLKVPLTQTNQIIRLIRRDVENEAVLLPRSHRYKIAIYPLQSTDGNALAAFALGSGKKGQTVNRPRHDGDSIGLPKALVVAVPNNIEGFGRSGRLRDPQTIRSDQAPAGWPVAAGVETGKDVLGQTNPREAAKQQDREQGVLERLPQSKPEFFLGNHRATPAAAVSEKEVDPFCARQNHAVLPPIHSAMRNELLSDCIG